MSKLALNIAHFKQGAVGSIGAHNWYKRGENDHHSNQDIDTQRSKDNIALVLPERGSLYQDIKSTVEQSTGRVTAASVWLSEWVVYPPEDLQNPRTADRDKLRQFYGDVLDWMKEQGYLVKLAAIHLDETTVHAHIDTVPLTQDGRLSRKDVYTRATLNGIHTDLARHLASKGWDIQRGDSTKNKQVRAVSVPEFKKQAEAAKLEALQEAQKASQRAQEAEAKAKTLEKQIAAQEETLGLIQDYEEYAMTADDAYEALDILETAEKVTPKTPRIFKSSEANPWLQEVERMYAIIRRHFVNLLEKLRVFERSYNIPEHQRQSGPITERGQRFLGDIINDAQARSRAGAGSPQRTQSRNRER